MENRTRRKYTNEFKEEAAKLVTEKGYTAQEAAKSLDIEDSNIRRWVLELQTGQKVPHKKMVEKDVDREYEVKDLLKKIRRLEMEKEILKKAAAFFAKENVRDMYS